MRTTARYVVLVITAFPVCALVYLNLKNSGNDDHNSLQDSKKWTRQRHQIPLGPGEIKQLSGKNLGNVKPRDHSWKGMSLSNEVEKFTEAYANTGSRSSNIPDQSHCIPQHNITFLKVHKTGSSTLQNVFLRFGQRHNLTFVLPPLGHHLGFPDYFEKTHMLHVANGAYNIFCHHTRFSKVITEIMPPNAIYVSILRDPVSVFESAFTYFKIEHRIGMSNDKDALVKFLKDPMVYYKGAISTVHMRNNMLFDFGVPTVKFDDVDFMTEAIWKIDLRFDLILIAEYFEESLILLRNALCWRTEDMVVFKMNSRNHTMVNALQSDVLSRIQSWNEGDMILYDYFNKTLWKQIDDYGRDRMAREVKELEALTESYYKLCIETDSADRRQGEFDVWQPPGVKINAFVLKESSRNNPICENMVRPEIFYTQDLRRSQFPNSAVRQSRRKPRKRVPLP